MLAAAPDFDPQDVITAFDYGATSYLVLTQTPEYCLVDACTARLGVKGSYGVLLTIDPGTPMPPQMAGPVTDPANATPAPELLHQESRDLIEARLLKFDDTAVDLGIVLGRCAVALTKADTTDRAEYCCNLGAGLFARHRHHGDGRDLDESISFSDVAAGSGFGDDRERARYLANLGVALHTRFQRYGRPQDLADSVRAHRRALRHTPDEARYRSQYAAALHTRYEVGGRPHDLRRAITDGTVEEPQGRTNWALMFRHRFELLGNPADLDLSIELLDDIVRRTGSADPDQSRRLAALAATLTMRFTLTDDLTDMDTAVTLHQQAVDTARESDPHRVEYLSSLGHTLHDRYEERGDYADLEAAVAAHAAAQSPDDPLRAGNQANALAAHFGHVSDTDSLDRALQTCLEAVEALPTGHIHRGSHLSNLGSMWFERFQRTHDLDDLENAVSAHEESGGCTPPRHIDRSRRLVNLAMALDSRYERTGEPADLDRAIELHRSAYRAAPVARRHHHAAGLGIALHLRFHLRGSGHDLTEDIALQREAVACRPDHPDRPRRQTLLASSLITRFGETGDAADVTAAAGLLREAVAATPSRHVQRVGREVMFGSALAKTGDAGLVSEAVAILRAAAEERDASSPPGYRWRTLGDALVNRWELTDAIADLEAAVAAYRTAIARTAATDPDQALNRYDAATALGALADVTGRDEPRRESIVEFAAAARQAIAPVLIRIHAAGEWAAQAVALSDPEAAADAYATAVDLLPRLAWVGLERRDQERALAVWNSLASDAAAATLSTRRPHREHRAVELGDQGRSLLWEPQLGLRRDHRDLTRRHPRLSARLHRVRQELLAAQNTAALAQAGGPTRPHQHSGGS